MRLISLELHGFKSFADAQKLSFPGGMTAVVGPNGCGKSNISDSLAWVLGEQRVSMLRGAEMADVIFAGTAQRRATGMAEVKLVLEMPDPALPGATREVVISRRLYRDTGSEYRINGREARLKDVQDLLLDTGMGTRAYSFIQQGQIDLILSSKPKDRRLLLEEAAGITRYKLRRADAEKRLDETKANLQRLDDILFELNKQMDSLRRQASRARKAKELDTEIKATQRILLAGKAVELEAAKVRILDQLDQTERRVAELTVQVSEKASEVEALRLSVDDQQRAQAKRHSAMLALDQRLQLAEQERGFQEERQGEATAQRNRLQERIQALAERLAESGDSFTSLEALLSDAAKRLGACEEDLAKAEEMVALAQGSLRHEEAELHALRDRKAESQKEALARQKQRLGFQSQIAQLEGRLDALNHEESVRAPRLESLQAEATQVERSLEGLLSQLEQAEEAAFDQRRRAEVLEETQRALAQDHHRAEAELDAAERRLRQISDLLAQSFGDEELKKGLTWLREQGLRPNALVELLTVDEALRQDLERLLGTWLQALSVDAPMAQKAAEAPGHLLLALEGDTAVPPTPPGCEALRDHLHWSGSERPLGALVDRAFRCSDEALPALAQAHPDLAFVSPGFIRLPFGPLQLGVSAPAASPIKLRAEQEEARATREALLDRLEELEAKRGQGGDEARGARERSQEIDEDLRALRRRADTLKAQRTSLDGQLAEIRQASERADALWEQIETEIKRIQGLLRELDEHPEEAGDAALDEAIQQAEGLVREARLRLDERRDQRSESARTRDAAWAERDGHERHLQLAQRGRFDLEAERQRLEVEATEQMDRITACQQRLGELEAESQQLLQDREAVQDQAREAQPRLELDQEALRVHERAAREFQEALENARAQHQEVLIHGAQVQGSQEALAKEVELALGLEVPAFLAGLSDEEREAWEEGELVHQTRLNELQGRRMDLGGVNPLAIQELEEAETRLTFMNEQRADVTEAIGNLESTIQEINATSEDRFREAFDFVNLRFQEVFREAFGGGSAQLSLEDPKNLLECGIEITAQPPGKTAKALTLLSGGEKALTAISLLFAIFHFKPSPFCVLDEVDAPLDEANVGRFAAMVQKMKTDTQFIVITHQKPTMVAADTLYGVTMEEAGCSRLVSVQLREAEALV
ncbi:chromosome segregation protein SMC [Geothrix sp. PMB-07]|uniref:chromosome segregation protein SMC n=1 Tax=Geothrix sp. PMB-07 TaxID=3068640 RepID=UPI0027414A23|nr:chromosome segregation protein SMC [Geothrix sp. PMB-07]WLT33007.1 chromosome segregation protein SMC [Geothrix sp. PMB-07]